MRKIMLTTIVVVLALLLLNSLWQFAKAGEYCTTAASCRQQVTNLVATQDSAAMVGGQWKVSYTSCIAADKQQRANEARCRNFDKKWGGKTLEECARCYRQVREDIRRWIACHKASGGKVPMPPAAIYQSLARLGAAASSF